MSPEDAPLPDSGRGAAGLPARSAPPRDLDDFLDRALDSAFAVVAFETGWDDDSAAAEEDDPEPATPDRIGRYEVTGLLGRGGMGHVYAARDLELDRPLAIKVLSRRLAGDEGIGRSFLEEARLCSQLQHPGVVPIHELGTAEDGRPFFTMKIVAGETLQHRLRHRVDLAAGRRRHLEILETVCQTVAYAHDRGVLHRDLKSGNVMIGAFGEVHVLDWGLARRVGAATAPGGPISGTPSYMSPEQARGQQLGPPSDVFSLGGILCEILTGAPPYAGRSRSEIFMRAGKGWLDDARERLRDCAAETDLSELAADCLELRPEQRPQHAGELAARLRACLDGMDRRARELLVATERAQALAAQERRARRRTLVLAGLVVLAVIAGASAWLRLERDRAERRHLDEQSIARALLRADGLLDRARRAAAGDPEPWQRALTAAQQAARSAVDLRVDTDLLRRAGDSVEAADAGLRQAHRDRDMERWLTEIRPHRGNDRGLEAVDGEYTEAFRNYGFDLAAATDAELARQVETSAIRGALATALDDWALQRRRRRDGTWQRLVQIATLADTDPIRRRIMQAMQESDRDALRALAAEATAVGAADGAGHSAEHFDLLGKYLDAFGLRAECLALYRRAHLLYPGDFNISHNLAGHLLRERPVDFHEVLRMFSMAASARPRSPHALADLGRAMLDTEQFREARDVLVRARDIDPSYARTWLYLGVVQDRLGDTQAATDSFRATLKIAPGQQEAHRNLVLALLKLGQLTAAEEALTAAVAVAEGRERTERLQMQGRVRLERGRTEAAIEALQAAAKSEFADARVHYDLGRACFRAARWADAATAFVRAVELDPSFAEAWCNLGHALVDGGRFAKAIDALAKGHELGSTRTDWSYPSEVWLRRARDMQRLQGELPEFLSREASETSPTDAALFAEVAARIGRWRTACELYARAFTGDPELTGLRFPLLRYTAACAAARLGFDPAQEDAARWRAQALRWLQSELETLRHLAAAADQQPAVREQLDQWAIRPALAPTRAAGRPDFVEATEWAAWRALWAGQRTLRGELAR